MKKNENLTLITQIGIVVNDLDAAMEQMRKVFGVEPDAMGQTPNHDTRYYGEEEAFCGKMAFYRFANVELEMIEHLKGRSIWQDYLKDGNFGLHHLRFGVKSFDATVRDMGERGYPVAMEGPSVRNVEGLKWAYFDTFRDIGFVTEIFNDLEILG